MTHRGSISLEDRVFRTMLIADIRKMLSEELAPEAEVSIWSESGIPQLRESTESKSHVTTELTGPFVLPAAGPVGGAHADREPVHSEACETTGETPSAVHHVGPLCSSRAPSSASPRHHNQHCPLSLTTRIEGHLRPIWGGASGAIGVAPACRCPVSLPGAAHSIPSSCSSWETS